MTSAQAIAICRRIVNKYDDTSVFTDDDLLTFLNMGQLEAINKMIPDSLGGVVNYEFDQNTYENIRPLISQFTTSAPTSTTTTRSTVTAALVTALAGAGQPDASAQILRVLSLYVRPTTSPYVAYPV